MKTKIMLILFSCFMFISMIGCESASSLYEKAIDFEAKDIYGKSIQLSKYQDKVIILNFFATWCPPCRSEMPDFEKIAKEYKNDVEVIAINVGGENPQVVKDFARTNNLTFSIIIDDRKIASLYGPIRAIPVTFIIDKDFNIQKKYIGSRSKEVFVNDIKELL